MVTSSGKRKHQFIVYSLPLHGVSKRVCKQFFLKTLCISEKLVWYTFHKIQTGQVFTPSDMRGREDGMNHTIKVLMSNWKVSVLAYDLSPWWTLIIHGQTRPGSSLAVISTLRRCITCTWKFVSLKDCHMWKSAFPDEVSVLSSIYPSTALRKMSARNVNAMKMHLQRIKMS